MRSETSLILEVLFTSDEVKLFASFAEIVEKYPKDENRHFKIWEYDKSLSGLGGYACPLNPINNPFNTWGKYRNVFRSLQYARSDLFLGFRPRHIIEDTGLHFESLAKILVEKVSKLDSLKNRGLLGKNIETLHKKKSINDELESTFRLLIKLLNLAKHDTDETEVFTFDYMDAVVFYFACRKVGNVLLRKLKHSTSGIYYEILIGV